MLNVGLVVVLLSIAIVAPAYGVPTVDPATGHSYEVIQQGKTWADARDAAAAMSTATTSCHLATITSQEENDFVVPLLGTGGEDDPDVWIGGERRDPCPAMTDDASFWGKWVTGETWDYTNWRTGDNEPDNCEESCLLYGRDEPPAMWENEFCDEGPAGGDEEVWYLVECEPVKVVDPVSGHSYELVKEGKTWFEARVAAANLTTTRQWCHLATITSQAENDFVAPLILSSENDVWIGGERRDPCPGTTDDASFWGKWVTGEPWVYTNWAPDAPDECNDSCLKYTKHEEGMPHPPVWDEENCNEGDDPSDEEIYCLVECEPRLATPVLSIPVTILLLSLLGVGGWWRLKKKEARPR